jgi:hypothetical protein
MSFPKTISERFPAADAIKHRAINAAIIAGNPPHAGIDRLRDFWTQVTTDGLWPFVGEAKLALARVDAARNLLNQFDARSERKDFCRAAFDARRTLSHREILKRPTNHEGVFTFDLDVDGRE